VLDLLTINLGATSRKRAERFVAWLSQRPEQVFMLTETSSGQGTAYLLNRLHRAGYHVVKTPDSDDRGAALVSRVPVITELPLDVTVPGRVAAAVLETEPRIMAVAVYVPSRDRTPEKANRKQVFLSSLLDALDGLPDELRKTVVLGGDYNVISRSHRPQYRTFLPFEYDFLDSLGTRGLLDAHLHLWPDDQPHSWIGRTGDGYRYDYFHVDTAFAERIAASVYLHACREEGLTDHAAVNLVLDVKPTLLDTTRPTIDDVLAERLQLYY
jgi:exodeoxyribonuclease-3